MYGSKIKKLGIPLQNPSFYYIKVGFKRAYISRTCFPDVSVISMIPKHEVSKHVSCLIAAGQYNCA